MDYKITIEFTDEQYNKLCDILSEFNDCGPVDYGWPSEEMMQLSRLVISAACPEGKE